MRRPNPAYDVELVIQGPENPICWVASCTMVKGFCTKTSIGVGDFTSGFEPSTSSIPNLAKSWEECVAKMEKWGFDVSSVSDLASGGMTADILLDLIRKGGPAVLLHTEKGFPYGPKWRVPADATGSHAVVITGVNTDAMTATFNNPWGDKDQICDLNTLVEKINADQSVGKTIGFWISCLLT